MSDQTFEQSLIALRDWLAFLDEEEHRLVAKLERLKRASGVSGERPTSFFEPPQPQSQGAPEEEEDDWL